MKIVMLCDFYNESLEYQENLLAKYYIKHGHDVTIIASTFSSVFDYYADKVDKTIPARTYFHGKAKIVRLQYRFNVLNRLRLFTRIYGILEQENPDLIFVHDIALNILEAIKYKKRCPGCRIILDYHADYSNSAKNWLSLKVLHGVIRKWFLDRARSHISKIFPVVPASAIFLNEVYGVSHSEMELLPLGADTDLGNQVMERNEGQKLRESFGIPKDDLIIFTGGKLAPAKRTELVIEVFKSLEQRNLHLIIIGDASEANAEYKAQLHEQANGVPKIHFTGWLASREIYSYLDMADIAVFPASQSILWQQAISMGLPLIVGDAGHQDISYLNIYENIIILKHDQINVENIQEAVELLVNNDVLRAEMACGAKRVADEFLNWDVLIGKTLVFNT